jgi:hypothetical protein
VQDQDYIAKLEKAISEKYGEEAIKNPKSNWDEKKEEEYLRESKILQKKIHKTQQESNNVQTNDFFVSEKLLRKDSKRECSVCKIYSFLRKDDVYMSKFHCCFNCYIQWVEGREERWEKGWRPIISRK